jgi:hypothetical protein
VHEKQQALKIDPSSIGRVNAAYGSDDTVYFVSEMSAVTSASARLPPTNFVTKA